MNEPAGAQGGKARPEGIGCHRNISGLGGWLLLTGYIGTLALYAYTFGVHGTAMFGRNHSAMHHLLESLTLLLFLGINLYGVKAAGKSEDMIVMVKVLTLALFAIVDGNPLPVRRNSGTFFSETLGPADPEIRNAGLVVLWDTGVE